MKVKFEVINCDCSDALPIGLGVIERAMPGERLGSTWSATGAIEWRQFVIEYASGDIR